MGARDDIQTQLGTAFDTDLLDAVSTLSLVTVTPAVYDPTLSVNAPSEILHSTRGIFIEYGSRELINQAMEPTQIAVLILQNEVDVTPKIDDYIQQGTIRYKIVSVMKDPFNSIWEITCQK